VGGATKGSTVWRSISWQGRLLSTPSNGTNTWANSQVQFPILVSSPVVKVRFANMIQDGSPANTGEQSLTTNANTISVRASLVQLYNSGTLSAATATTATLTTGFATPVYLGKEIVITNGTNGQQSAIIIGQTGNVVTVASWLGGTPAAGASYRIYDLCRFTFNGAQTLSEDANAIVDSDAMACPVKAGNPAWVITNVYTASGLWPSMLMPANYSSVDMWTNTGTGANIDATGPVATNAWSTTANSAAFAPVALLGQPAAGSIPTIAYNGDSINLGTGQSNDAVYGYGLGQRYAVSLGWPALTGGIPGETTTGILQPSHAQIRMAAVAGAQYVFSEIGVNDAFNAYSLATTKSNFLALWLKYAAKGATVIQRIPTPYGTTSTDGWTSTGNQTVNSTYNTARAAIADWLRDTSGAGAKAQAAAEGVTLIIWDPNSWQETAQDNGIWVPATLIGTITTTSSTAGGNITVPAGTFASGGMADVPTNPDRYQVKITSGSGVAASGISGSSGKNATIASITNSNTQINLNSTFSVTPANGDTIQIWTYPVFDGSHMARSGIEREITPFIANIVPTLQAAW
jgi:hypothetical protein